MTSTVRERLQWFDEGKQEGHDFMIIVHDRFDHENYPVYASAGELATKVEEYDGPNMQSIDEVFNLKLSRDRVSAPGNVRDDKPYKPGFTRFIRGIDDICMPND